MRTAMTIVQTTRGIEAFDTNNVATAEYPNLTKTMGWRCEFRLRGDTQRIVVYIGTKEKALWFFEKLTGVDATMLAEFEPIGTEVS